MYWPQIQMSTNIIYDPSQKLCLEIQMLSNGKTESIDFIGA